MTPKAQETKAKTNTWDYIKLQAQQKNKQHNKKATYGTVENVCKPSI